MSSRKGRRKGVKTLKGHGTIGLRKPTCINPDKHKFWSVKKAREVGEKWGQQVYACGNHFHLTTRSWGDPGYGHRDRHAGARLSG